MSAVATAAGYTGDCLADAPAPSRHSRVLAVRRMRLQVPGGFTLDVGAWALHAGDRAALIGRNGSGKSTLLEVLAGLRPAARVEGSLLGLPLADLPRRASLRHHCGVLLQQVEFSAFCRVRELVALHGALYAAPWPQLHQRLGMEELAALRARTLSRGQRQRLLLYLALAHRPALALLDEPLTGLDRRYSDALHELLHGPELAHTAMLIVGHTPEELALCDQYLWLHEGALAGTGSGDALLATHLAPWRASVQAASSTAIDRLLAALPAAAPVRRIERPQPNALMLFAQQPLDAWLAAQAPPGGWHSMELGRTQMADLLRAGPRRINTPGELH